MSVFRQHFWNVFANTFTTAVLTEDVKIIKGFDISDLFSLAARPQVRPPPMKENFYTTEYAMPLVRKATVMSYECFEEMKGEHRDRGTYVEYED